MTRTPPLSSALLGAFAVAAACSYDFDQYLAPAEVNAGGSAGATTFSGGSSPGGGASGASGASGATGGLSAGGGAAGHDGSAANGEGGEAGSTGGTMGGGAPPTEGGASSDAGAGGESASGAVGGSPPASGGSSIGGTGVTGGTAGNSGAPDGGGGGFDCAEAFGTVFNGHCYFLMGNGDGDGLEWNYAKEGCANLTTGSHLVTITSEAEEQFVEATFFPATTDHWIGLALTDTTRDPPISCRRTPATCPFSWVTGEALSYTNWESSGIDVEPNYTGGCVRIEADSTDWADLECDEQLPAICEID